MVQQQPHHVFVSVPDHNQQRRLADKDKLDHKVGLPVTRTRKKYGNTAILPFSGHALLTAVNCGFIQIFKYLGRYTHTP